MKIRKVNHAHVLVQKPGENCIQAWVTSKAHVRVLLYWLHVFPFTFTCYQSVTFPSLSIANISFFKFLSISVHAFLCANPKKYA